MYMCYVYGMAWHLCTRRALILFVITTPSTYLLTSKYLLTYSSPVQSSPALQLCISGQVRSVFCLTRPLHCGLLPSSLVTMPSLLQYYYYSSYYHTTKSNQIKSHHIISYHIISTNHITSQVKREI